MALDYTATIEGVPADAYRDIMQAERQSLYPTDSEYLNATWKHYQFGTFSDGRPMFLLFEGLK